MDILLLKAATFLSIITTNIFCVFVFFYFATLAVYVLDFWKFLLLKCMNSSESKVAIKFVYKSLLHCWLMMFYALDIKSLSAMNMTIKGLKTDRAPTCRVEKDKNTNAFLYHL